jgi:hypothetical protein
MSLVAVENLTKDEIDAKLQADLAKAVSPADQMTIYSAYSATLTNLMSANNSQTAQYRAMKEKILADAHVHHMDNIDLHQSILGLIDSRLVTYKPTTASQALTGFAEGWLDNPYGNWGYDAGSGKHYIRLFCQAEGGTMWMPNASKLFNMNVVLKDQNSAYISTAGATLVDVDADGSMFTTGSGRFLKLYFTSRAERDKLVRPLFDTDELVGEVVWFVAQAKFPTSGVGMHWSATATEAQTPSWLIDEIGRETDP